MRKTTVNSNDLERLIMASKKYLSCDDLIYIPKKTRRWLKHSIKNAASELHR